MLASHTGRRLTCTPWISIRYYTESSGRRPPPGNWGLKTAGEERRKLPSDCVDAVHRDEQYGQSPRTREARLPNSEERIPKPSLMEQLFPEEVKRHKEAQKVETRELPLLPLQSPALPREPSVFTKTGVEPADGPMYDTPKSRASYNERHRDMAVEGEKSTVLVLRNVSANLTEDDFRRATPQGQHLEGWSLEQGSFLKVVPGRDLATLEQQNFYYLIFRHQMAAYHYQGHVSILAALSTKHTPSSVTSVPAPPPGYRLHDGRDLHAALQSYSLTPPTQALSLRQLKFPLSPLVESIVRHQGYSSLVQRRDKLPFEVRLTLDGPQLSLSIIQFILHETALARSLGWSGGEERVPRIAKWQPVYAPPAMAHWGAAEVWRRQDHATMTEEQQTASEVGRQRAAQTAADGIEIGPDDERPKRRVPKSVYIVGFHTEAAAQSFVSYWHRRPMYWKSEKSAAGIDEKGDTPAITNAELLW